MIILIINVSVNIDYGDIISGVFIICKLVSFRKGYIYNVLFLIVIIMKNFLKWLFYRV